MNGIRSSPAARIVASRSAGSLVGEPWWATRSGLTRLEHQPLRGGDLAQPREVVAAERAEVRVRQQPALQRALAAPHDVGDEVLEAERGEALAHAGVVAGVVAGEDEQLLDAAARGAVDQPLDLVGLVQVRLVRRERAVLAVRDARARQRQRDVAREGDPAAHREALQATDQCPARPPSRPRRRSCRRHRLAPVRSSRSRALPPSRALRCAATAAGAAARPRRTTARRESSCCSTSRPNAVHAGIYLAHGARRTTRPRASSSRSQAPGASTDALKLLEARPRRPRDPRHPRPRARARAGRGPRRRHGARAAAAGRGARAAGSSRPRDLEGQRVGVTGLPSDDAVLRLGRAPATAATRSGAGDHDRLPGGQGAARRARRRRDRVLERRGRGARAQRPRDPRVPRRRLRRPALPRARALRDAARRSTSRSRGPGHHPRAAARLRRGAGDPETRRHRRCSPQVRASTATSLAAQLDAVAPGVHRRRRRVRRARPAVLRAWARWDVRFGILDARRTWRGRSTRRSSARRRRLPALLRARCGGTPAAPTRHGPTSGTVSTRPVRSSRRTSSPSIPAWSSSLSVPCTTGPAAACPN